MEPAGSPALTYSMRRMGKQLSKVEILALHQALYEELTATRGAEFLTRPELAELTGLTAASVHHALSTTEGWPMPCSAALTVDSWFSGNLARMMQSPGVLDANRRTCRARLWHRPAALLLRSIGQEGVSCSSVVRRR